MFGAGPAASPRITKYESGRIFPAIPRPNSRPVAAIAGLCTLRYMRPDVKLFSFDVDGETLELVPLAARRALDNAGWKLSLAGFQSLALPFRRTLVELGSVSPVDLAAVARCIETATPSAARLAPRPDPASDVAPPDVAEAFVEHGPLSNAIWSSLDDLDRYALVKLASRDDPDRRRLAYAEIIGHTRVSTHVRASGGVQMVNVGNKPETRRRAEAESRVSMSGAAFRLLESHTVPKGDVLATARVAAIMAAKRTSELIPLCHPLALSHIAVDLRLDAATHSVHILASVETRGKTGVEMEALVAASHAALTVYDMLKSADRSMQIGPTRLLAKSGGASGDYAASASTNFEKEGEAP